jgi:adenosylmethionine-8-amino-7-oxononanoate aminotransferase
MVDVSKREFVLRRGEGVWVWDAEGNRYLDATASLWYCFVGYGRTELVTAATEQMGKLPAYSTFGDFANEPALELAQRLSTLNPIPNAAVFFTSGGSESVDTAAKLARRYWIAVGQPQKQLLVTREGSYHGMAGYGTSLAGIAPNAEGYGELVPGVIRIAPDDAGALEQVIAKYPNQIAAFFGEPVRGAGGVYPPPPDYWTEVQRMCRKYDILLVSDEVVTGFGRLGHWFGCSRFGVQPDMITLAKGVTSGYLPLGAVLCGERVQEPFWNGKAGVFRHGYTYSGHATCCAVAQANLDLIERERLVERSKELEPVLRSELQRLENNPLVQEIRCIGLTAAIQLSNESRSAVPDLIDKVIALARTKGVLTRSLMGHSLHLSPPLVISRDEIHTMVGAFEQALSLAQDSCCRRESPGQQPI